MSLEDVLPNLKELENLYPLRTIAEKLDIKSGTLHRWAERHRKLNFPEPKKAVGRYNLYDLQEVAEWVYLWQRVSDNMGNGELNGTRTNS